MIVVIMAEDHDIDAGQIVEGDAGHMHAPGTGPTHGTHALAVNRIGEHGAGCGLKQERRVVDPLRAEGFAGGQRCGRARGDFDRLGPDGGSG